MKSILIPVEAHAAISAVLETARLLALRFGSYMEGVALGPDLTQIVAADFSLDGVIFDDLVRRDLLDDARTTFESFMHDHGIEPHAGDWQNPSWGWTQGRARLRQRRRRIWPRLRHHRGRAPRRGAAAAAQIDARSGADRKRAAAVDRTAAGAGATRRMYRNRLEQQFGDRAQRRLSRCLCSSRRKTCRSFPFPAPACLDRAKSNSSKSLKRHGVPARVIAAHATAKTPGLAVLVTARSVGADLLIKGGYTQSRLRQMIFGGATSQILAEANLPVFMAH